MTDATAAAIEARHREVLGQPPRIAPLDRQSAAEQVQADTAKLRGDIVGGDAAPLPLDAIPEIMFTMAKFPEIWARYMAVSMHLQGPKGALKPRDRQLAILRTGWLLQAPFEWGEHARQSKAVGITTEEIERVTTGSSAPGWSDHDRAILRAAEELREGAIVSDETWDRLALTMSESELLELLLLIGQFTTTAYFQNALRLRLEPGNPGLSAR
ncbi:MAG: carboxymuconolactone decarboxylase family protein [Novosphingobium sp.]